MVRHDPLVRFASLVVFGLELLMQSLQFVALPLRIAPLLAGHCPLVPMYLSVMGSHGLGVRFQGRFVFQQGSLNLGQGRCRAPVFRAPSPNAFQPDDVLRLRFVVLFVGYRRS